MDHVSNKGTRESSLFAAKWIVDL